MPKSLEDKIEERARRRYRDMLASAGVSEADIGKEILFLLPTEFVRMYQELWDLAYGEVLGSPGGGGRDEGRIKRSGSAKGKGSEMKTRKMSGAAGGGKRYTPHATIIRREEAVDAKIKLDRKLVRAAETALKQSREQTNVADATGSPIGAAGQAEVKANSAVPAHSDPNRTKGTHVPDSRETAHGRSGNSRTLQCSDCGQFQGPTWIRCPFHE
jgi:hypothetical protein